MLEHFISTMRFDMFHLSPWVSGMHMAEFLVLSAEIGAHSWHHAYYVGTTFYIYQTLIALEVIKSTDFPVMERLCDLFKDTVFLGQRPLRNLLSCYQRWSGGTLSFPKGHCDTTNRMHNHSSGTGKKWTMKYVRDASQGGNHPHRGFNPMKISLLVLLARRNFVLDDDVLAWVHCSKPWPKVSGIISIWPYICVIDYSSRPARKTDKKPVLNETAILSLHDPSRRLKKSFLKSSEATFRSPRSTTLQSTSYAWRSWSKSTKPNIPPKILVTSVPVWQRDFWARPISISMICV